jgi:hypothetical protein
MYMASIGSRNSDEATDVSFLQNFQTGSEYLKRPTQRIPVALSWG